MVLRHGEGLQYDRDLAFEKATWSFQAAPAVTGLLLALGAYTAWKLINLVSRTPPRHPGTTTTS